jgi:pimeloyl-ACP methyl ester carboxylesterase
MRPDTHYARSGDIHIAYQVIGDGPLDLIVVPGFISNVDFAWEDPYYRKWVQRLSTFCRVILFDKRGIGQSDRDVGDTTLEERMDDLRAVLAAVGSERAVVVGYSEGGPLSMMFAASYPERVISLVLYASFARATAAEDYPEGAKLSERFEVLMAHPGIAWGQGITLDLVAPSSKHDPKIRRFAGLFERMCLSPRAARNYWGWIMQVDARPIARAEHADARIASHGRRFRSGRAWARSRQRDSRRPLCRASGRHPSSMAWRL